MPVQVRCNLVLACRIFQAPPSSIYLFQFYCISVTDFNCLTDYLAKELPWEFSMVRKRAILWTWINSFDVDKSFKSLNFLRYLINPMVRWAVTHGQQELFDQEIVKSLVAKVFKGISTAEACDEQVQAESVQLCSVLMQYAQSYFREQRKELIQYIWYV